MTSVAVLIVVTALVAVIAALVAALVVVLRRTADLLEERENAASAERQSATEVYVTVEAQRLDAWSVAQEQVRADRNLFAETISRLEHEHRMERERFVRALVAKNTSEFRALEAVLAEDAPKQLAHAGGRPERDRDIPAVPEGL